MIRIFFILLFFASTAFSAPFDVAHPGKSFSFPQDDQQHPTFKTEWWYFTGNLMDESGKKFGYQLTFFRNALGDQHSEIQRKSIWSSDQLIMAHFAVTDVQHQSHISYEKMRRTLPEIVGFEKKPWAIHIDPWSIKNSSEGVYLLTAAQSGTEIKLTCSASKPRVFQGDHGYSRKGKDPGNASYYVSFPRMKTDGQIKIEGKAYQVTGESWMDHEISTSALDENQTGWDWFAIQLSTGEEVMIYQLRDRNGKQGEFSSGTWIDAQGASQKLSPKDFTLTPTRHWKSSKTKTLFPIEWDVRVPSHHLDLHVNAKVDDQEMSTFIPYWEGAIDVSGSHSGQGYLELTGYSGEMSDFLGGKDIK